MLPSRADDERFEDVALALDPTQRFVASVTSRAISIWSAQKASAHPLFRGRHLFALARQTTRHFPAGQQVEEQEQENERRATPQVFPDGQKGGFHAIYAVWLADGRLAVAERGATAVELNEFHETPALAALQGCHSTSADAVDPATAAGTAEEEFNTTPTAHDNDATAAATTGTVVADSFLDEYPLNRDEAGAELDDVAYAMTGLTGSTLLFVGMRSGMICVVQVPSLGHGGGGAWYSSADPQRPRHVEDRRRRAPHGARTTRPRRTRRRGCCCC